MKTFEVTQKTIGENRFFIRPFPAFKSAFISGEVFSFLSPIATGLIPAAMKALNSGDENVFDTDITSTVVALSSGLSGVNGDKVEGLLKRLLIQYKTISVDVDGETILLTEEVADQVFCGNVQDMYILAFEVIKVNFPGIFTKFSDQFGEAIDGLWEKMKNLKNTEPSMPDSSQN